MYEEKSEDCQLQNHKQPFASLPSCFPWLWQQNRNQALKSSPEPWQAWSQHILERSSTYAAAETGDNIWQKRSLGSTQQRKAWPWGSWMVPCAVKQSHGLPTNQHVVPWRRRAQTPPPAPCVAPVPPALLFPAPILLHYCGWRCSCAHAASAWAGPLPTVEQITVPRTALQGQHEQEIRISWHCSNAGRETSQAELMRPRDSLTSALA